MNGAKFRGPTNAGVHRGASLPGTRAGFMTLGPALGAAATHAMSCCSVHYSAREHSRRVKRAAQHCVSAQSVVIVAGVHPHDAIAVAVEDPLPHRRAAVVAVVAVVSIAVAVGIVAAAVV